MAQGHNNQQAANIVGVHRETAQQWRNRWLEALNTLTAIELGGMDDKELLGVVVKIFTDVPRMGAPVTFTAKQVAQLLALACEEPQSSGRPISHWSSRELADEAIKRGIFQSISPRSVGRFLKGSRN